MSPFKALYGYNPLHLAFPTDCTTSVAVVEEYLKERDVVLKDSLAKAREIRKWFADRKRTDRSFEVGDWVYLKLQPYRQSSIHVRRNFKLSSRYYGPYIILERIREVAYRLDLMAGCRIHPVFHVSQLKKKKKIGETQTTVPMLPPVDNSGEIFLLPVAMLDTRTITKHGHYVPQLLIQWSHTTQDAAAWEDQSHVRAHFPKFSPLRTRVI
ncbi:uncharacterized protein LOC113351784 [Papaver somniferum]|uniref:uncharacterized protein LOC113351784 n=1 Tax=Papaver somniferum TaxID=3469 RepID=UPI000E6FA49D|nr:uncharacterized protein LOC113351784 [Papaver somniferum]